jgi:hypothetical protein
MLGSTAGIGKPYGVTEDAPLDVSIGPRRWALLCHVIGALVFIAATTRIVAHEAAARWQF